MVFKAKKVGTLKDGRLVYRMYGALDSQLSAFRKVGISSLITPEEVAEIQLENISYESSRTSIAFVAAKGARTILLRDSPLMNPFIASAAVYAHRSNKPFECTGIYESAEGLAKSQDSIAPEDRSALIVSQDGDFDLTSEMPEAQFILRRQAKSYFDTFTKGKMQFSNYLSLLRGQTALSCLDFNTSSFSCDDECLDGGCRAFGVMNPKKISQQK